MSFNEVKELRQAGNLDQAYELAKSDLENDPEDIWNKRSIGWVLYDKSKKALADHSLDNFYTHVEELCDLELPSEEHMVYDNIGWQIAKAVFKLTNSENINFERLDDLFSLMQRMHFSRPSEVYSVLLKAFLKAYEGWSNFLQFIDWWYLDNLRSEDYHKEKLPNGRSIISLAERTYIAYSKKILEGENRVVDGIVTSVTVINKDRANNFLPRLEKLINSHPEYQYPPYYKAKLLLAMGEGEDALSAFLPFARSKQSEFWIWQSLGETFPKEDDKRLACYCKGLTCKANPDFLIKLRQETAEILVARKLYREAITEIEKLMAVRESHDWKVPFQVQEWQKENWYLENDGFEDNSRLYEKYVPIASEILTEDVPEEIAVVEFVNVHKKMLNFIISKQRYGYFKYAGFLEKVETGDIIKVRLQGEGQGEYYKILSASISKAQPSSEVMKPFEGEIRIREGNSFGFVDNIFIDPDTIKKNQISDGDQIKGRAILSFNKKKNDWGWKGLVTY